ncbi:MAG: rod shape-determining protein MreC [Planctomycetaceae bacterium]
MPKLITTLCLLTAIGLSLAPLNVQNWLRASIRDGLQPGVQLAAATQQSAARRLRQHLVGDDERELQSQISDLRFQISESQTELRRERLAHQRTRDQKLLALQRHDEARQPLDPPPLIVPQVVEAHVLGDELAASWRSGKLLDRGRTNGVVEASLVLDANAKLLDQGEDVGLVADLPVFAGSCVIGKVQHVGHWSSTWVPLTDKRFRGRARLARVTPNGLVFGAEGILHGDGLATCSLTKIRATEPVSEGDEVFSLETPGGFETPLFYGTVTRAELAPEATHWEIEVRPAIDPQTTQSVSIVRPTMNPKRLGN